MEMETIGSLYTNCLEYYLVSANASLNKTKIKLRLSIAC